MDLVVTEAKPLCKTCGADVDINDPNGIICKLCGLYEHCCTCDPNEVVGPDPTVTCFNGEGCAECEYGRIQHCMCDLCIVAREEKQS